MARTVNSPQIVKTGKRLMLEIVKSTADFPVKYRHLLGALMLEDCIATCLLGQQAFDAEGKKPQLTKDLVDQLSLKIDRLKLLWQTALEVQCFSVERSEEIARILENVGNQCGGWMKGIEKRLTGQNPASKDVGSVP